MSFVNHETAKFAAILWLSASGFSAFSSGATFPGEDWAVDSDYARTRSAQVQELEKYLFPERTRKQVRKKAGVNTDGVVIVRGGQIVYERYANGYLRESKHLTWSVSKSFINALFGVAVRDRKLDLDESICGYLPNPATPAFDCRQVKIRHLLEWTSGLRWSEVYEASLKQSSVVSMLYTSGRNDPAKFILGHDLMEAPGSTWYYSSADTNLLSAILQTAWGESYAEMPWRELFEPIGIRSATWEQDPAGRFVGSSYVYATARDLARFGYLYLNDGVWDGKRILPEGWVAYSTGPASPAHSAAPHWWHNRANERGERPLPHAPADAYAARGHWGQFVFVMPSLDAVVVVLSNTRDRTALDLDRLAEKLVAFLGDPVQPARAGTRGQPGAGRDSDPDERGRGGLFYEENSLIRAGRIYAAKEICSCVFVERQSKKFCRDKYSEAALLVDVVESRREVRIHFASWNPLRFFQATGARWVSDRLGCVVTY